MIKVSFSVWQDNATIQRIYDAMDVKVASHKKWDTTLAWFSKAPSLVLVKEPATHSKGAHRIDAPYQLSVKNGDELKALWEVVSPIIGTQHNTPWGVKAATISSILPILSSDWWYDENTNHYFYHKVDISRHSPEFQHWAEQARLYDETWYYADRPNNEWAKVQRWLEETAVEIDAAKCGAYYHHILGKSFLNVPKGSKTTAHAMFYMFPQNPPSNDALNVTPYQLHLLNPCKGFPPHDKKVGWVQGDVDHCGQPITKEDYEANQVEVEFDDDPYGDDDYYYDE